MKIRTAAVLGILVAIAPPMFAAEKPCSMLTGAELSAATGAKVGEGQDTTMVIPERTREGADNAGLYVACRRSRDGVDQLDRGGQRAGSQRRGLPGFEKAPRS